MALDPDALVATSFPTVRRGADPDAVKRLLGTVAEELRRLRATEAELRSAAEAAATAAPEELDEAQVTELLGQETARVLGAAREAAAEIRAKAAERAERLERDAEAEAVRVRSDADAVAARRREQADADVDAARAEAAGVRADAEAEAQRRREEVDAEVAAKRAAADEALADARAEAERVRTEATATATALVDEATATATRLVDEATATATRLVDDATTAAAQLAEQAEADRAARAEEDDARRAAAVAEDLRRREDADAEVQLRRDEAEAIAADAEQAAAATIEAAKAEGRRLVIDAQAVRERVLADMARRRDLTRDQITLLQAGRDRIVAAYGFVRASIDEVAEELRVAVEEADELLAADEAAAPTGAASGSMSWGELAEERSPGDDVITRLQELAAAAPSSDLPATQAMPVLGEVDLRGGADAAADAANQVAPTPPVALDLPGGAPDDARDEPVELDQPDDDRPTEAVIADADDADDADEAEEGEPGLAIAADPAGDRPGDAVVVDLAVATVSSIVVAGDAPPVAEEVPAADGGLAEEEPEEPVDEGRPIATGPAAPAVEALFARIRSSRAEVVAKAQEVLDADGAEGGGVQLDVDPARAWVGERAAVLDPVERALGRRLKRVLADEESGVLDVLRRQRSAQLDELIGSADAHAARVRDAVREHLVEAVAAGEAFSRALSPEVRTVHADTLLDPVLDELVADLVAPLRARVAGSVSETGGSADDLTPPLRALYREWKTQRLDRAAEHAAMAAFGAGALAALVPGTPVRWAVEPEEGACPDGEDNALAGVLGAGEPFPTGHRHAPAHSTCRCQVVPADPQ